MQNLKQAYFRWLYGLVEEPKRNYLKLSKFLYTQEFTYFVPNDENRASDGKAFRREFIDMEKIDESKPEVQKFFDEPCFVFEMLVALSRRMDFLFADMYNTNRMPKWFGVLLKNLGIEKLMDEYTPREKFAEEVENMIVVNLAVMMNRTYDRFGRGSLFPITNEKALREAKIKDMRTSEIWYQMMAYAYENYPN